MIKAGIPVTLENYRKLIDDGRRADELSEAEVLDMFGEKKTPKGSHDVKRLPDANVSSLTAASVARIITLQSAPFGNGG